MQTQDIIAELEASEALLTGHFILSSGLHSPRYVQCARALVDPARAARLCGALAAKLDAAAFDLVIAPAMGGLIVGYELARQMQRPSMFVERVEGVFQLRRGFSLPQGARVLIVEDVVTTGKSSMETARCVDALGAKAVGVASLIDRRGKNDIELTLPLTSLLTLDIPAYPPSALPASLAAQPAVKPGSRFLKATA